MNNNFQSLSYKTNEKLPLQSLQEITIEIVVFISPESHTSGIIPGDVGGLLDTNNIISLSPSSLASGTTFNPTAIEVRDLDKDGIDEIFIISNSDQQEPTGLLHIFQSNSNGFQYSSSDDTIKTVKKIHIGSK